MIPNPFRPRLRQPRYGLPTAPLPAKFLPLILTSPAARASRADRAGGGLFVVVLVGIGIIALAIEVALGLGYLPVPNLGL